MRSKLHREPRHKQSFPHLLSVSAKPQRWERILIRTFSTMFAALLSSGTHWVVLSRWAKSHSHTHGPDSSFHHSALHILTDPNSSPRSTHTHSLSARFTWHCRTWRVDSMCCLRFLRVSPALSRTQTISLRSVQCNWSLSFYTLHLFFSLLSLFFKWILLC